MPHPQIQGAGLVGTAVTADGPVQWCRDGVAIPGAVGPAYTPDDGDDGCHLSARRDTPEGVAESAPLQIRQVPPSVRPLILDEVFDWLSGEQPIPAALVFEGRGLRYSLAGGRGRIDPLTGQVLVPTDRPHSGDSLTVMAENSGGRASLEIRVAVEGPADAAETHQADSLTVDGVTFYFDRPCEIGRFITGGGGEGDPFVIGPVLLLGYDPAPVTVGPARNGAMLNPSCGSDTGFDSRASHKAYKEKLNAGLRMPLKLVGGDSLIVGRSAPEDVESPKQAMEGFVVLSVLDAVPPEDAFRPPFAAGDKPIYRLRDLQLDRLGALELLGRLQDFKGLAARFDRFAMDISPSWLRDHFGAPGHPPLYGRDLCTNEAVPYIVANSDSPLEDKLPIIAGLVQRGIDRAGVLANAVSRDLMPWYADGGHNSGRKFSIMFAGHLLDVDWMRNVVNHVPGQFHEDAMTFYVTEEAVAISNGPDWKPAYGKKRPQQPYETAMIGAPDWRGKANLTSISASWASHPYRVAANHNTQHAQVLALLAMDLRAAWGHDAYVDYHMRYMEVTAGAPDPWRFRGGEQALYNPVGGTGKPLPGWQQYWHDKWSWQMLKLYRFDYYAFPWA